MYSLFYCYNYNQRLLRHLLYKGMVVMAEERKIVFKYELADDRHDVDVVALSSGLGHFCALLNFFCDSERKDAVLSIRAEAFRPGSFEVWLRLLEIVGGVAGTVVANNFADSISNVLDMFKQYIELKTMLGSSKADSVTANNDGTVIVVHGDNNVIISPKVMNFYMHDKEADAFVSGGASAVLSDGCVDGLRVQEAIDGVVRDIVSLDKVQLGRAASQNGYLAKESRVSIVEDATLLLVGANFEFRGVWRFQYGKRTITAKFADGDFVNKVRGGELDFRSKEVLTVDMSVKQVLDPKSGQWDDKDFVITKVKAINNLRNL